MTKVRKRKIKYMTILALLSIIASIFLINSIRLLYGIETKLRIFIIIIIVIIDLFFLMKNYHKKKKKKLYIALMIIYIIINIALSLLITKVYNVVNNINKSKITYSSSLITLSKNSINGIDDVNDKKIGMIKDDKNVDNYIIPKEIIAENDLDKNNEIIDYDDIFTLLEDLYKEKIDLIFVSSNYKTMFVTVHGYENIGNDVKEVYKLDKTVKKENSLEEMADSGKSVNKPFTLLLMGVDSEIDGLDKSASNGDSLILLTFNPQTLNATMVSIPRDSYVPIVCFKNKKENKITHAGWNGSKCMIDTIENFLDVNIDYYVKINFKGVVSLVNALNGVNVEVPQDLCTDSSNRTGKVCIKKGNQKLNGEEALVLARNRYDLKNGDFDRMNNQQILIKALMNEMKSVRNVNTFNKILDTVSNNLDTNLTTNQILSFYGIFKNIVKADRYNKDIINFEKLYLKGDGQKIYEESSNLILWNYILNEDSIKQVSEAMKKNLSTNPKLIKDFSYTHKDGYTPVLPGYNTKISNSLYELLPNFVGQDKSEVEKFAKENKLKVQYNYKTDLNSDYDNDTVISQSHNPRTRIDKIDLLEINLLKNPEKEKIDCTDNTENECLLPNFIGLTKEQVLKYWNKYKDLPEIEFNEVSLSLYPDKKIDTVVSQNYKVNTHLSKIETLELGILTK